MSALTPGMIEFAGYEYKPTFVARRPDGTIAGMGIQQKPKEGAGPFLARNAGVITAPLTGAGVGLLAGATAASKFFPKMSKRTAAIAGLVSGAGLGAGLGRMSDKAKKKTEARRVRAAATVAAIEHNRRIKEFARGDFAIPALKKALAKGIGNAGEPVSIHEIGVSGTMIPSLRKNAKNVQRATKKYWGADEGLDNAQTAMRYNRSWAAQTIRESRGARSRSRGLPSPTPIRLMSALNPGMVAFALGEDNRPRNGNGQFVANETGGADPNSMAAAYGNVEAEKMSRRQGLMARLKAMMGR